MVNLKAWFGKSKVADQSGNPLVLYHGTGADFDKFKGMMFWASTDPKLADDYSDIRKDEGGLPTIYPVYMKINNWFDADELPNNVTIGAFFSSMLEQARHKGMNPNTTEIAPLITKLKEGARTEESGPYYGGYEFWHKPNSLFGTNADQIIVKIFQLMGFDGIKLTEAGYLTFGVFARNQVKSAIGNTEYSDDESIIKEEISPKLKAWFGNSVVKNKDGSPRKVYHGTNADFKQFSLKNRDTPIDQLGMGIYLTDNPEVADAYTGGDYGNIMPLYVKITKPISSDTPAFNKIIVKQLITCSPNYKESLENWGDIEYEGEGEAKVLSNAIKTYSNGSALDQLNSIANDFWDGHDEEFLQTVIKLTKHDGLIERDYGDHHIYVVWSPSQIKSAIGNSGEYSGDNLINETEYPLADHNEWYGERQYADQGGKLIYMSPDEYLSKVRPLTLDDESLENIDLLVDHIKSGQTLDPLKIFADGKEDGRHRAYAAKKLGIEQVPVIVFKTPLQTELEEGWTSTLTGLGTAAAMAVGGMAYQDANKPVEAPLKPSIVQPESVPLQTDTKAEKFLASVAKKSGIKGMELAQFLAQCAHETGNFVHLKELGNKRYFTKNYDITGNPAKAKALGNTKVGDGAKYHGRGYIQLTGKAQYEKAGEHIGVDLVAKPQLAEEPEIAAQIAVWYWNHRVKPKVNDFEDTNKVTKLVNGSLNGIDDRLEKFNAYSQLNEAASSEVYHYSDLHSAYEIIKSKQFKLTVLKGHDIETAVSKKSSDYYLSTTRSKVGGYHKDNRQGVVFNIDGNKVNQRYRASAVDYWNDRDPKKAYGRTHEAEDRIYANTSTIPFDIVTSVHILYTKPTMVDEREAKRVSMIRQMIIECKKSDIPVYLYDNNKSWSVQDIRKALPPSYLDIDYVKQQPPMYRHKPDYGLAPYIELLFGTSKDKLSSRVSSKLYDIKYGYDKHAGFKADWHNAKNPSSGDYENAKKIVQYMRTNNLKTINELMDNIKKRWAGK